MHYRLMISAACLIFLNQPSHSVILTDQTKHQSDDIEALRRSLEILNKRQTETEDLLRRAIIAVSVWQNSNSAQ